MSFGSPALLACLLVVPAAVVGLVWLERRRTRRGSAWAAPALLPNIATGPPAWRRWVPASLLLLGVTLLLVGFARPRAGITVGRNEATIVIVVDISGSMAANDAPPTRLEFARRAVRALLEQTPSHYRVAVVAFSDHAAVVAPPTRDRAVVLAALARLHPGPQGTALTDAVLRGVQLAHALPPIDGKRPPASVLVVSDGAANAGRATQQQVIAVAHQDNVPVSAMVVGTPSGVVQQKLAGGYTERIAVPVETRLLGAIVGGTGGHAYPQGAPLTSLVRSLGSRAGREHKTVEVTAAAAGGGLVCMLAAGLLSGAWFRRIP